MPHDLTRHEPESSVRAICPRPGGGGVITMGFPGLDTDIRGQALIDPERLDVTLTHAEAAGLRLLLILTQRDELPEDAIGLLRCAINARKLHSIVLPIKDYAVPGAAFLRAWRRLSPAFRTVFAAAGSVGMCCHHGAGRSGMVAAMLLIDAGHHPIKAVSKLRVQFSESVENEAQYEWLLGYARSRHGGLSARSARLTAFKSPSCYT